MYLIVMEPASDQAPWLYQGLLEEIIPHCSKIPWPDKCEMNIGKTKRESKHQ